MPDHRKLLLISVLVLTTLFFIDYFFIREYLPEYIPETSIRIGGAYLFLCFIGVYYFVFKRILKEGDSISLGYLVVFGALIALFSEVIFQFYRLFTLTDTSSADRVWFFTKNVLLATVASTGLVFMLAMDMKYKYWWTRWLSTLIGIGLLFGIKYAAEYWGFMN